MKIPLFPLIPQLNYKNSGISGNFGMSTALFILCAAKSRYLLLCQNNEIIPADTFLKTNGRRMIRRRNRPIPQAYFL